MTTLMSRLPRPEQKRLPHWREEQRAALHLYPTDWLRFEVGTEFGTDSVQGAVGGANALAARPVVES